MLSTLILCSPTSPFCGKVTDDETAVAIFLGQTFENGTTVLSGVGILGAHRLNSVFVMCRHVAWLGLGFQTIALFEHLRMTRR